MRGKGLGLKVGLGLLSLTVGLTLVGFFWLPDDPLEFSPQRFASPSLAHPLGTDWFGRDLLARVLVGGRASLGIAGGAVALGALLGLLVGGVAGWRGGGWEEFLMRGVDFLLSFPALLLALLLATSLGPGPWAITLAIASFNVPYFARVVRGALLVLREEEYVLAARAVGASPTRILLRHLLPNLASPLLVQLTVSLSAAVLAEAAFSYLGLGSQPPHPSWGRMLKEARTYVGRSPWPALVPGLFIIATCLGLNLVGDGLRDLLDPRLSRLPARRP